MPQMSPYNWFLLNFLFMIILLMNIILLNFMPLKKKYNKIDKKLFYYFIKW